MNLSTKRISKLQAELDAEAVPLRESRARLARLEARQQQLPANPADTARGAQVVNLQQMHCARSCDRFACQGQDVVEWRCRCDQHPPLPEDHQAIEEWMTSRNRDLRDTLEFGSADVISFVSNLLARGTAKLAARRASALSLQSMEVQTSLGSQMVAVVDEADATRRCLEGGGH